jgi:hypothetical protein
MRRMAHHEARGHVLALTTLSAVSGLATLGAPALLHAPLVLIGLSPRLAFLTVAAHESSLVPFVLVGTLRLALADPLHFDLGRRYGDTAVARLPRWLRRVVERSGRYQRPVCAGAVFLRPNGMHLVWAGSQGLSAPLVAALDVAGTVLYLLLLHTGSEAVFSG